MLRWLFWAHFVWVRVGDSDRPSRHYILQRLRSERRGGQRWEEQEQGRFVGRSLGWNGELCTGLLHHVARLHQSFGAWYQQIRYASQAGALWIPFPTSIARFRLIAPTLPLVWVSSSTSFRAPICSWSVAFDKNGIFWFVGSEFSSFLYRLTSKMIQFFLGTFPFSSFLSDQASYNSIDFEFFVVYLQILTAVLPFLDSFDSLI